MSLFYICKFGNLISGSILFEFKFELDNEFDSNKISFSLLELKLQLEA